MKSYLVTRTITETIVVEANDEGEAIETASHEATGWDGVDNYVAELLKAEEA